MVPSASELVEPSNLKAKAVQTAPVTGTQSGDPLVSWVAAIIAAGGLSVIVSAIGPPACTPGMVFDEESTKITLVMVKLWMLGLGTLFSSKATLANNVSAVIVTAVLGAMIVRKTVNAP